MPLIPMLGVCGVLVFGYLLTAAYMSRRDGIQPRYTGLLVMLTSAGCFVSAFYILRRFGLDLLHGPPLDIFWLVFSITGLVSAVWTVYQQQMSGTVLMDLGPAPMFKLWMGLAALMGVLGIGLAIINSGSRDQAFSFTQSAWLFVMAGGRFEVRDHGVILSPPNGLLPWNRIAGCEAIADNIVRLKLNKGLQRTVDIRLPADRRDEFIQLVNARKGVTINS
jgi:hypothetical protein